MITTFVLPPWLSSIPDLFMMRHAETVVVADTTIFSRKSRVHRSKIRTPDGAQWLHIPIHPEDRKKPLHEVRILQGEDWTREHLKILGYNYRNSLYFDFYEPEIQADYEIAAQKLHLIEATEFLFTRLLRYLEVPEIPFVKMSYEPERCAALLSATETLWCEANSHNYLKCPFKPTHLPYKHPIYRQHFSGFTPDCCLYDVLFQYGPESFRIFEMGDENVRNT